MDNEVGKRIVVLPDYLKGHEDHVIHQWRMWESIGNKIDNYPGRFVNVAHPKSGAVKTFDCKTAMGIMEKSLKNYGILPNTQTFKDIMATTREIQVLKSEKGRLNTSWSKYVYGKKGGDKSILGVKSTEVLDLFGKFYTVQEVKKIIAKDWGMSIKFEALRDFYNDNADKIEIKKAEYILKGKDVRLATDAGRMEILSNLAWEMEQKFEKSKTIEVSKELRAIIEQIRKEVKGDEIRLTIDGKIDIQATIQANQTLNETLSKLPINMIVVGLTAAKQGLDASQLMASLCNSYYAQFNGFSRILDKSQIQLPGQYIRGYDWEEIKRKNEQIIEDVQPIEVFEEKVTVEEKEAVVDNRNKLLALLKQTKELSKDTKA